MRSLAQFPWLDAPIMSDAARERTPTTATAARLQLVAVGVSVGHTSPDTLDLLSSLDC